MLGEPVVVSLNSFLSQNELKECACVFEGVCVDGTAFGRNRKQNVVKRRRKKK